MNFNDLENFTDLMLTLLEEDLEPSFRAQSAVVNEWDAKVHQNCDVINLLPWQLEVALREQSELETLVRTVDLVQNELAQSISVLERCPQETTLLPVSSSSPSAGSSNSTQRNCCRNVFAERNNFYRALMEVAHRMDGSIARDWQPSVDRLRSELDDFRRSCEKHYHPIVAVMAAHTEILTGLESQLDAIERRLASNGEQIRKLGPASTDDGGKSWRELFTKLLGMK
uniref:Nucleoporin NSP1-like C-terminal domain-containing protein n=1 Tax=Culex tarsalis TaxID=7177 RepID=A0A1Q3FZZ4_CULTA